MSGKTESEQIENGIERISSVFQYYKCADGRHFHVIHINFNV